MSFSPTTQPISTALGDLFWWQSQVTIPSNVAPNNTATDRLQVDSDSFFVLMGFLGATNYDNVAGDFIAVIGGGPAAARALVSPPFAPNNFEVDIQYNSQWPLFEQNTPMPQACICSNATRAGQQLPAPIIVAPMSSFDFTFYNVAPTLLKQADRSTAIDLQIAFGLYGYFIPAEMLASFLTCYPMYQAAAASGMAGWIQQFTTIDMAGVPGV